MLNSAAFVTGFSFVFVLLGATATGVGSFLMQNNLWFQRLSGIILVLLGLNFTGIVPIKWLSLDRRLSFDPRQLNFFKSFLFGTVFAFAWTPCVGPLLGAALIMASNVDTIPEGVILLLLYSAGLGIPFLVCAALFERLKSHLLSLQKYSRGITIFSGLVLIFAGVMLFTNQWFYLGG